jgi:peroxiredoxin
LELQSDYDTISELDAEILAISIDDLTGGERVVERLGLAYQILSDPDAEVIKAYGVFNLHDNDLATPATFLIDKQGTVRWEYIGRSAASDRPDNQKIIEQLQQLS